MEVVFGGANKEGILGDMWSFSMAERYSMALYVSDLKTTTTQFIFTSCYCYLLILLWYCYVMVIT